MERKIEGRQFRAVTVETKEADPQERSIVHWISTESVDRYGDIVRAAGLNDANFAKNPVVLFGHDHRAFPVGKSLWRKVTERGGVKGVLAKTQFADTAQGHDVFKLWDGGYLNAASIGFIPLEYTPIYEKDEEGHDRWTGGYEFTASDLLEYSIVPVPANQEALRLAIDNGVLESRDVLGVARVALFEKDVCELRECGKDVKTSLEQIGAALIRANLTIEELKSKINALENPPEKVVRLTGNDLANVVHGAFKQMKGKIN
jgi:HK97 family phage prohead protease